MDADSTRRSWNIATRNHNAHKGDQAAFFRDGGDVLFPEEVELLGDLRDRDLVHLQCNAGQDSLSLARRGARVTGIDLSDVAVAFARQLSSDTGIPATFVNADVIAWMDTTNDRFDLAFSSYGACVWLADLHAWARGIGRVLRPGGRFVYLEYHPVLWSVGKALALTGDDYFATTPFIAPVGDYVAESGAALGAPSGAHPGHNDIPATAWQHGLGDIVQALIDAGLTIQTLCEWPHANGCRVHPSLQLTDGRRYVWPEGTARLPLMFGVVAATRQ